MFYVASSPFDNNFDNNFELFTLNDINLQFYELPRNDVVIGKNPDNLNSFGDQINNSEDQNNISEDQINNSEDKKNELTKEEVDKESLIDKMEIEKIINSKRNISKKKIERKKDKEITTEPIIIKRRSKKRTIRIFEERKTNRVYFKYVDKDVRKKKVYIEEIDTKLKPFKKNHRKQMLLNVIKFLDEDSKNLDINQIKINTIIYSEVKNLSPNSTTEDITEDITEDTTEDTEIKISDNFIIFKIGKINLSTSYFLNNSRVIPLGYKGQKIFRPGKSSTVRYIIDFEIVDSEGIPNLKLFTKKIVTIKDPITNVTTEEENIIEEYYNKQFKSFVQPLNKIIVDNGKTSSKVNAYDVLKIFLFYFIYNTF